MDHWKIPFSLLQTNSKTRKKLFEKSLFRLMIAMLPHTISNYGYCSFGWFIPNSSISFSISYQFTKLTIPCRWKVTTGSIVHLYIIWNRNSDRLFHNSPLAGKIFFHTFGKWVGYPDERTLENLPHIYGTLINFMNWSNVNISIFTLQHNRYLVRRFPPFFSFFCCMAFDFLEVLVSRNLT